MNTLSLLLLSMAPTSLHFIIGQLNIILLIKYSSGIALFEVIYCIPFSLSLLIRVLISLWDNNSGLHFRLKLHLFFLCQSPILIFIPHIYNFLHRVLTLTSYLPASSVMSVPPSYILIILDRLDNSLRLVILLFIGPSLLFIYFN